jgi:hypothetical protein
MPKHLVAGFMSKDKFCLTDTFIGLLLLCYIIVTTNITDTMEYTLTAHYSTLLLSFERSMMLNY